MLPINMTDIHQSDSKDTKHAKRNTTMGDLNIQRCPETGICSIIKPDGKKVDLMPSETIDLEAVSADTDAIQKALAEIDADFAASLAAEDLAQIGKDLR